MFFVGSCFERKHFSSIENTGNPFCFFLLELTIIIMPSRFLYKEHLVIILNLNLWNLYSVLTECNAFSSVLHNTITAAKANHYSVLHQYEREPPSLQINSLGSIQVRISLCAVYLVTIAFNAATHTHIHIMVDRSTVVGHVPMVHMCSFMCTNHIHMIAHTPAF